MEPFRERLAGRLSGGMKQKLALMCTLIHRPAILFLDEPTNGVDPVSRRDFWAILYQLVKDGITVFVTTAYLDEAERCNRLGFLHRGRLIRCDTPPALKTALDEQCYEVECADARAAREILQRRKDVLSVEPFGATLHLFTGTAPETLEQELAHLGPITLQEIVPSLEDVFIALVRRSEARREAA
jgi:ABC-2 type transport system ATP-binding protein